MRLTWGETVQVSVVRPTGGQLCYRSLGSEWTRRQSSRSITTWSRRTLASPCHTTTIAPGTCTSRTYTRLTAAGTCVRWTPIPWKVDRDTFRSWVSSFRRTLWLISVLSANSILQSVVLSGFGKSDQSYINFRDRVTYFIVRGNIKIMSLFFHRACFSPEYTGVIQQLLSFLNRRQFFKQSAKICEITGHVKWLTII